MKKVILVSTILISSLSLFGQSKSETKEWISRKCDYYQYKGFYAEWMNFQDNYLITYRKIADANFYQKIEISKISQYLIERFDGHDDHDGYEITLFCKNKNKCIEEGRLVNNKLIPLEDAYINYNFSIYLELPFSEDDQPKRMEKAIKHLVKLYGGNATIFKDTF